MKTRRIIALISIIALSFSLLTSCSGNGGNKAEKPSAPVKIATLNGPTGIGMVDLMDDENYDVKVFQAPTDVIPEVIKGSVDVACVPSNMASVLYNKTKGQVVCVSPIVMGMLHIVANNVEASKLEDLKGKTIVASGKGGTPEYALQAILASNELKAGEDVKVEWLTSHADVLAKLMKEDGTVAVLPEPFVSTALTKGADKIKDLFDMNDLWSEATSQDLPMGVLVARKEYAEKNEKDLMITLDSLKASIDDVNGTSDDVIKKIVDNGFISEPEIAKKAIPNCNLCLYSDKDGETSFESGAEMMKTFNKTLFGVEPKSVGGKLPGDDLYFEPKA